jgi:hypothetical protein
MEPFNRLLLVQSGNPSRVLVDSADGPRRKTRSVSGWHSFLVSRWPRFMAILLFYAVMAAIAVAHGGGMADSAS